MHDGVFVIADAKVLYNLSAHLVINVVVDDDGDHYDDDGKDDGDKHF